MDAVAVAGCGGLAVPGLEAADMKLWGVPPPAQIAEATARHGPAAAAP
jgi:hypothetical protein